MHKRLPAICCAAEIARKKGAFLFGRETSCENQLSWVEMLRKRPTRADVAEKAGVSPSTVTLVMQNKADALRITLATQEKVKKVAREIGYVPNQHIQAVRRGRSGILGVYLREDQYGRPYGYWTSIMWAIQHSAASSGVRLLIHNAPRDISTDDVFAFQAGGMVDGALILNSRDDPIVPRLLAAQIPAVEVGDPYSPLPYVGMDPLDGMKLAVDHAVSKGYKRLAHLTHVTVYVQNAIARSQAFVERCQERGIEAESRILTHMNGWEALEPLLALDPKPDCVICMSDELAYELLRACEQRGVRVPEDMAIIGFDALDGYNTRLMTSVATPVLELGRLAVEKLLKIINGEPYDHSTLLRHQMRVGETT
jgi:LacI family transcriptional regulator